jgi:glycosyltransferase involved in cell wall biosynthesis
LVACGRLTLAKGFDDLIRAVRRLDDEGFRIRLVILGEGELRPDLEATILNLGLQDRVTMPGFVSNPFSLMSQADLFVSSSRWESFGNVVIEAMALGVPVVATATGAAPDLIANDTMGTMVRPGDPSALADAIGRALSEPHITRQRAMRARAAAGRYDRASMCVAYETRIFELLEQLNVADAVAGT